MEVVFGRVQKVCMGVLLGAVNLLRGVVLLGRELSSESFELLVRRGLLGGLAIV